MALYKTAVTSVPLSHQYFLSTDIGELQKWALQANNSIVNFNLTRKLQRMFWTFQEDAFRFSWFAFWRVTRKNTQVKSIYNGEDTWPICSESQTTKCLAIILGNSDRKRNLFPEWKIVVAFRIRYHICDYPNVYNCPMSAALSLSRITGWVQGSQVASFIISVTNEILAGV